MFLVMNEQWCGPGHRSRSEVRAGRVLATVVTVLTVAMFGACGTPADSIGAGSVGTTAARPSAPGATVHPGPELFRIGTAVAPVGYWMTAWMFNDIMRTAGFEGPVGDTRSSRMWVPEIEGQWLMEALHAVAVDSAGWPVSMTLTDGRRADRLTTIVLAPEVGRAFPAGIYRLLFDGSGTITVAGGDIVAEPAPGERHIRYEPGPEPGESGLLISILETDPAGTGDYLRNFRLYRPDASPAFRDRPGAATPRGVEADIPRFTRRYLDYLRPYTVIRPLHFLGDQTVYGPRFPWEDRTTESYSHWGGAMGAPYEVAADLANRSDSDLWLNVPIAADDAFVGALADLMVARLDDGRKLYVELGNELWNWSDPYAIGRQYALTRARARWPGILDTVQPWSDGEPVHEAMLVYSWQGARTVEVGEIFRAAFGAEADRVVVVLAGQIGASAPFWHPSRYLLETPVAVHEDGVPPAGEMVDAFAVAPYVGEAAGEIEFSRRSPEAFLREAIAFVRGEGRWHADATEPGLRYQIRSDVALAREWGLPLVAYEGGQHFTGSRFTRDVVNPHPAMYDLYRALLQVWREEGGGLFVHFAGIVPRGVSPPGAEPSYFQSENFGVKELQTQTPAEAPKWRALLDEMRATGQY